MKKDDDKALWAHVTRSVRALDAKAAPVLKTSPGRKRAPEAPAPGFKRKKGAVAVDARLDLHGLSQEKAFKTLCRFVRRAVAEERRCLLVITGKGGVREGGGVLRRALPLWCGSAELSEHVISVAEAKPEDGGSGAFYVRLRKALTRR